MTWAVSGNQQTGPSHGAAAHAWHQPRSSRRRFGTQRTAVACGSRHGVLAPLLVIGPWGDCTASGRLSAASRLHARWETQDFASLSVLPFSVSFWISAVARPRFGFVSRSWSVVGRIAGEEGQWKKDVCGWKVGKVVRRYLGNNTPFQANRTQPLARENTRFLLFTSHYMAISKFPCPSWREHPLHIKFFFRRRSQTVVQGLHSPHGWSSHDSECRSHLTWCSEAEAWTGKAWLDLHFCNFLRGWS